MSMDYVRRTYGVPVKRGQLVRQLDGVWKGEALVVTRCTHRVHARPRDRKGRACQFHPWNLEYKTNDGWWSHYPGAQREEG